MRHYQINFPTSVKVYLACTGEWIKETKVTVENIEEDIQGRDVLTFMCPECKQQHKSLRVNRA